MSGYLQKPGSGGGGGTWGSILGTLSNQTDLQNALNLKYDASNPAGYITSSALSGYTPTSRTITINGTAHDLSADRTWSVGTVTSVAALTLGTTGTDLSSTVATGTTTPVITLNVPTASATNRGALSSTDWSTFNSKFTLPSLTTGSVLFSNGSTIAQDNANFFWDATNKRLGVGTTSPSARLHLAAGTATASTAPIKFTSGTNLTVAEAGSLEYNGSSLFFTRSGTLRAGLLMTDTASPFNTYSQSAKGATAFTSGTDNFLGGQLAGGALTAGSQNVMIGTQAGNLTNSGLSQAVFLGYFAGQSASGITTGSIFVGSQAGQNGAWSYNSNFIGQLAGFNASNAYHSNLFGYQAGYGINANNVNFFGQNAGYGATLANDTVGIGQNAGRNATGSVESIFVGKNSGYNAVSTGITGDFNLGLGTDTLKALTTGAGNIALGYKVGDTITTGSKNVAIGYDIDYQSNTTDGQLTIQNAIFGTGNTGTGTTASTGNIGIYTPAPTARLHLPAGATSANTAPLKFTSGSLNNTAEAGAIEYNNTFHVTNSDATRRHIVTAPNTTKVTASAPYTNDGYITINIGGTDFKVMTTA